jgi:hypothetical protein
LSGRKPVSKRFSVRSDSFHTQKVQLIAGSSCKRELNACISPSAFQYSTVSTKRKLSQSTKTSGDAQGQILAGALGSEYSHFCTPEVATAMDGKSTLILIDTMEEVTFSCKNACELAGEILSIVAIRRTLGAFSFCTVEFQ